MDRLDSERSGAELNGADRTRAVHWTECSAGAQLLFRTVE